MKQHIMLRFLFLKNEYLEPGNSFEECVVIHMQSAPKFKVISKWEDEMGNEFLNEQLRSC